LLLAPTVIGCAAGTLPIGATQEAESIPIGDDGALAKLGVGFDRVRNESADFCVDGSYAKSPVAGGQQVIYDLELIESSQEMEQKMNISAQADMHFGLYGGDLSVAFAQDTVQNSNSTYLFVKVEVHNADITLNSDRHLKADAADTLAKSGVNFRRRCGDGFVSGVKTGGVFMAILDIQNSNYSEKQNLDASLKVSGALGSWSASAQFSNAINKASAEHNIHVRSLQFGGTGVDAQPVNDVAGIVARAQNMPVIVAGDNAVPFDVDIDSYDHLALPTDTHLVDIANQQEVEVEIVTEKNNEKDVRLRFADVVTHPDSYVPPIDMTAMNAQLDLIDTNLNTLRKAAATCFGDYTQCAMPILPSRPDLTKLPKPVAPPPPPPTAVAVGFDVHDAEVDSSGWGFRGDDTDWARAMRAAHVICARHGFVGGYFNGYIADDRHGLVCYRNNGNTAAGFDAHDSEIAATGWPFKNNDADWAWAMRAADGVCQKHGFTSGHFNGYINGDLHGLICYGGSQISWFDAHDSEIGQWDYSGDNATWDWAARAMSDFCQKRGFVGGHANGWIADDRHGTICAK
jgi:hypothetical protein